MIVQIEEARRKTRRKLESYFHIGRAGQEEVCLLVKYEQFLN